MTRWDCRVCGQPFALSDHRDLHVGRWHPEALDTNLRAAFEQAQAREDQWLDRLDRHVRGSLYVLPMALFYVSFVLLAAFYAVAFWAVLPLPGAVVFMALAYYMGYTQKDGPKRG